MSKWFDVDITYAVSVMVEVRDDEGEEEALDIALDSASVSRANMVEAVTNEISNPAAVKTFIRHADQVERL
jgi:hypothetical protein